jgi:hypothetical protein
MSDPWHSMKIESLGLDCTQRVALSQHGPAPDGMPTVAQTSLAITTKHPVLTHSDNLKEIV